MVAIWASNDGPIIGPSKVNHAGPLSYFWKVFQRIRVQRDPCGPWKTLPFFCSYGEKQMVNLPPGWRGADTVCYFSGLKPVGSQRSNIYFDERNNIFAIILTQKNRNNNVPIIVSAKLKSYIYMIWHKK